MENSESSKEERRVLVHGLPLKFHKHRPEITLCYCKEHNQILISHARQIDIYMDYHELASTRLPFCFIFKFLLVILATIFITIVVVTPSSPKSEQSLVGSKNEASNFLRDALFESHKSHINSIAQTFPFHQYDQSILGHVIKQLDQAVSHLQPSVPCLCHHHLHVNYSLGSKYGSVCLVQLAPFRYQPLVNPQVIPLDILLQKIKFTARSAIKETSWILPNATRWRQNALGVKSIWPNYETNDATHHRQVETVFYDSAAHCMALALNEMETLRKNEKK